MQVEENRIQDYGNPVPGKGESSAGALGFLTAFRTEQNSFARIQHQLTQPRMSMKTDVSSSDVRFGRRNKLEKLYQCLEHRQYG